MWAAFARQAFAYALTKRGKRLFGFIGVLLLGFITALLVDMQLYISASFIGAMALAAVLYWLTQHLRVRQHERERQQKQLENALRRAANAEARAQRRNERWENAKSTVGGTVRAAGDTVRAAKDRTASAASAATSGVASAAGSLKFWKRQRGPGPAQ